MRHRSIKYRRRGPRHPLTDASDSAYYAAIDTDHDAYRSGLTPERCYIDPWDLENYDYVRKQLGSPSRSPTPSPINGNFFYFPNVPRSTEECPACYAGMDEQTFYNAKYETILDDDQLYSTFTDFEGSSSAERNSSCSESSVSTLMLHTPGFGPASGRRRMVLPKPAPRLEFPAPPPYDYSLPVAENNYCSLSDCYDCCMSMTEHNIPLYAPSSIYGGGSSIYSYPHRFGLSKKGLLQIDYSCNWNDLDRYIAKEL